MQDKDILTYVAGLARIKLSQEEERVLKGQFADILNYVDKLKQAKVEGVEPMRIVHQGCDAFRDDQIKPFVDKAAIIKNAPGQEEGCFKVPKIIG